MAYDLQKLPVDFREDMLTSPENERDHYIWKYWIVRDMDMPQLCEFGIYDDMPDGFELNYDFDTHDMIGWFWRTPGRTPPFIGADAIASYLLIKTTKKIQDFYSFV